MKTNNISFIAVAALLMATTAGCTGNKEAKVDKLDNNAKTEVANADIRGQWYIVDKIYLVNL